MFTTCFFNDSDGFFLVTRYTTLNASILLSRIRETGIGNVGQRPLYPGEQRGKHCYVRSLEWGANKPQNEKGPLHSKGERDRCIARTNAHPSRSFCLGLRGVMSVRHPRDVPDHGAACHDTIVHFALTPTASRILHVRCHMQHGAELRGLEKESTLKCWVECHTRWRVSRGSMKD